MRIIDDPRPITRLFQANDAGWHVGGACGTTKIVAYEEYGQMAPVTWFEIWKGDVIVSRVNGASVEVVRYE